MVIDLLIKATEIVKFLKPEFCVGEISIEQIKSYIPQTRGGKRKLIQNFNGTILLIIVRRIYTRTSTQIPNE